MRLLSHAKGHWTLALLLSGVLLMGAAAPSQSPTEAIRHANDRLRQLLAKKADTQAAREKIDKQINAELHTILDIPFLTRLALADHWEKMTPKQRNEVTSTLQAIVDRNYLNQLRGNLDYKIDYVGEEANGEDRIVKTFIRSQKNGRTSKVAVNYTLRPEGDHWRIFDITTEEVSILRNYRDQFNRVINKDGVDGLIAKMKNKLKSKDEVEKASEHREGRKPSRNRRGE